MQESHEARQEKTDGFFLSYTGQEYTDKIGEGAKIEGLFRDGILSCGTQSELLQSLDKSFH